MGFKSDVKEYVTLARMKKKTPQQKKREHELWMSFHKNKPGSYRAENFRVTVYNVKRNRKTFLTVKVFEVRQAKAA